MYRRTKLLLLIPHLGGGGAEHVIAHLAGHLDPRQFEIHLALMTEDHPGAQSLPPWVTVHRFQQRRVRHAWLLLLRLVRSTHPDVIVSGMAHLNFLVLALKSLLPSHIRILVRQNTTASSAARSWLERLPYRTLYPRADAILCQSQPMADDLTNNFAIPRSKLPILGNPVDVHAIRASTHIARSSAPPPSSSHPRLLCVARLAPEKGIDLLLRAFISVIAVYPNARLTILGTGPQDAALRRLASQLGLEAAVDFAGFHNDLASFYAQSTLFVLPSRHEGMPNALLEAAAAGLPLVATPSSAGLCDLLLNSPGAWLTRAISAESLSETILQALAALKNPGNPSMRFEHAFLAPFESSNAIAAYTACIQQIAAPAIA